MNVQRLLGQLQTQVAKTEENPSGARWKHRRRLVYLATSLGTFMILFGLGTFWWDRQVSVEAIISGTAILTVVLGAYLGTATWDDVKLYREPMHAEYEGKEADG